MLAPSLPFKEAIQLGTIWYWSLAAHSEVASRIALDTWNIATEQPLGLRLTHWPLSFLPKMHFLDILVVFRLDIGQISSNLVKKAFATQQFALLATLCFSVRRNQFFRLSFVPFLFFLLQWFTIYWACLLSKNFLKSIIETGNFYQGVARCSGRKFCSEFFTQLFEHFCAYLGLHIRPIFSSCRSWV